MYKFIHVFIEWSKRKGFYMFQTYMYIYMYIYVYIYIYIYMYIYRNPDVSTILVDFRGSHISCALLCGRGVGCMLFARMHETHLDLSYLYVQNPEDGLLFLVRST